MSEQFGAGKVGQGIAIDQAGASEKLAVKPARAALLLDCSRTKIYDAINSGELRAIRIAGMLRIPISEIRRRLE
jgi:excisionase family DNA binding protein